MINDLPKYKASLTREQFLFYEIKTIAQMLCKNMERKEISERVKKENLFQYTNPTKTMVNSITNACFKRIYALNSEKLTRELAYGSLESAKQVNLYSMMRFNRIVWDFMITVIGEKYRTLNFEFSKSDLNIFIFRLQEQNDTVASWSDSTITKIKQILKKSLVECEYLDNVKSENLNNVIASDVLIEGIKNNKDFKALLAFNYFK